jgi:hypothetical protein
LLIVELELELTLITEIILITTLRDVSVMECLIEK